MVLRSLENLAQDTCRLAVQTFSVCDDSNLNIHTLGSEFLDDWAIPIMVRSEKHAQVCRAIANVAALTHLSVPVRNTYTLRSSTTNAFKKILEK